MNLTTKQAAERLEISEQRVRVLIGEGRLKAEKFGKSHSIRARDVIAFSRLERTSGRPVRTSKP